MHRCGIGNAAVQFPCTSRSCRSEPHNFTIDFSLASAKCIILLCSHVLHVRMCTLCAYAGTLVAEMRLPHTFEHKNNSFGSP